MPAWQHTAKWTPEMYQKYRKYVETTVPNSPYGVYEGAHEDCADLSIKVIIDFAAQSGLPVTFRDDFGWRYISKAERAFSSPALLRYMGHPKTEIRFFKTSDRSADGTKDPWLTKDDLF
jgi:hypothetical protein